MEISKLISLPSNEVESRLSKIIKNFHEHGPTDPYLMEQLSYLKKFHEVEFSKLEYRLLYVMGLFYKDIEPISLLDMFYHNFSDVIAKEVGEFFTPVQMEIFNSIRQYRYYTFSAPTSVGKSFLFQHILKEEKKDIVIIVPSRALISEYYQKVTSVLRNRKDVLVLQFVENINLRKTSRRIFILTPERAVELFKYMNEFSIGLFLIDEAHISEENLRGIKFDWTVRRINSDFVSAKKVFAHPFVDNPVAQLEKHGISNNYGANSFKQLSVGKIFLQKSGSFFSYFSPHCETQELLPAADPMIEILSREKGCILIFSSKKDLYRSSFDDRFLPYTSNCCDVSYVKALIIIDKLKTYLGGDGIHGRKSFLLENMRKGIVIHHGSIPLRARLLIEEFVRLGFARICFCTSTLSQGINMPFEAVWVDHIDRMKPLDLKNLIGRAGRSTKSDKFDFGYTIVNTEKVHLFRNKYKENYFLSSESALDKDVEHVDEDSKDLVESLRDNTFNDNLYLPQSQVNRLSSRSVFNAIEFILDSLFVGERIVTANEYIDFEGAVKTRIKKCFSDIFTEHLRRDSLTKNEKSILSSAIPILLWRIQGRSFKQIVALRHAYITRQSEQRILESKVKNKEITVNEKDFLVSELKARYHIAPTQIPDVNIFNELRFKDLSVLNVPFDHVIYDTYDYLDKVISLSLVDPLCAAFKLYADVKPDTRVSKLLNYIRYGTNDRNEIMLLRYGLDFEDIEWVKHHVKSVDENEIVFKDTIRKVDQDKFSVVERFF